MAFRGPPQPERNHDVSWAIPGVRGDTRRQQQRTRSGKQSRHWFLVSPPPPCAPLLMSLQVVQQVTNCELQTQMHVASNCWFLSILFLLIWCLTRLKVVAICSAFSANHKNSSYRFLCLSVERFLHHWYIHGEGLTLPWEATRYRLRGRPGGQVGSWGRGWGTPLRAGVYILSAMLTLGLHPIIGGSYRTLHTWDSERPAFPVVTGSCFLLSWNMWAAMHQYQ